MLWMSRWLGAADVFLELFSYTASPWLVLYSTGLFQPSDCLILEWLYQRMYSPARPPASSHVRSSQCPEMHGLDLHTAEEPLGRGVVGAALFLFNCLLRF